MRFFVRYKKYNVWVYDMGKAVFICDEENTIFGFLLWVKKVTLIFWFEKV
jgi:hypothetical protein